MVRRAKCTNKGVWGHALPEIFEFRGLLRVYLVHSRIFTHDKYKMTLNNTKT